MPLSLGYFYLRSLNTSKELSCLVDTGVHLGEGLGNPQAVSLSAENTDVIFFTLPASEQRFFCLLSTSAILSLLSPDIYADPQSLMLQGELLMLQGKPPHPGPFKSSWLCQMLDCHCGLGTSFG